MIKDIQAQFRSAMQQRRLIPPQQLITDGMIHRCDVEGKDGKNDGAYLLHLDSVPAGGFENHRDGMGWENWRADIGRSLSTEEIAAHKVKTDNYARTREAETAKRHAEGQAKAKAVLSIAQPATGDHLYEKRKRLAACSGVMQGAWPQRGKGDCILIPMYNSDGTLWNVQAIFPEKDRALDRDKDFLSGARKAGLFFPIGQLDGASVILIGEGFATMLSCHMATGMSAVVAFDAGNVTAVVKAIKGKYPNARIIIAGDDDKWGIDTNGKPVPNTGRLKAEEAAKHHGCCTVFPVFAESTLERLRAAGEKLPTDWNDVHCLEGIEALKVQLQGVMHNTPDPVHNDAADDAEIARLAKLPLIEYEREREAATERLGIKRVSILDMLVKVERDKSAGTSGQGRALSFMEVESWPEPVDGTLLLDELTGIFKRFTVLPPHADITLALWVCFTWCIDALQIAPILGITSPEMRCGKTTVLAVLNLLTYRPLPSANISPSSLFRSIDKWQPTLLIDEADTYLRESEEMRGIINSGHTRPTAYVIRNELVGNTYEPCRFSTWGAKAIALIGKLPGTLADRAIVVTLRRKLPKEKVEKLRYADKSVFDALRRKLARFAQDNAEILRTLQPPLPDDISDRAADNWEPLLAIAGLGGNAWKQNALQAARELSGGAQEVRSLGTELLADIEIIFTNKHCEKIPSAEFIEALCADSEKPWATYNRGNSISPRQIAKILSEYGIRSKSIRLESGHTPKGYEKAQFKEAFSCYLPPSPRQAAATTPQSSENLHFKGYSETPQENDCGGLETAENARLAAVCGGVADKNTPLWETEL